MSGLRYGWLWDAQGAHPELPEGVVELKMLSSLILSVALIGQVAPPPPPSGQDPLIDLIENAPPNTVVFAWGDGLGNWFPGLFPSPPPPPAVGVPIFRGMEYKWALEQAGYIPIDMGMDENGYQVVAPGKPGPGGTIVGVVVRLDGNAAWQLGLTSVLPQIPTVEP